MMVCAAQPAGAQFNAIAPPFAKLTGGYMWGSLGYRDVAQPERFYLGDRHPFVRGGFGALFGPFGGQPDTTPPRVLQVVPESGAVLTSPPSRAEIDFDEVISEQIAATQRDLQAGCC